MSSEEHASMDNRNGLLIITIIAAIVIVFLLLFFYFNRPSTTPGDTVLTNNEPLILTSPESITGEILSLNIENGSFIIEALVNENDRYVAKTYEVTFTDETEMTKRNIAIPSRDKATTEMSVQELRVGQDIIVTTENNPRMGQELSATSLQYFYQL